MSMTMYELREHSNEAFGHCLRPGMQTSVDETQALDDVDDGGALDRGA
jgi:hypothetical protein